MTKTQIIQALPTLSDGDLRDINRAVISQLKFLRNQAAITKRHLFHSGDRVQFTGRTGHQVGEIVRVKQKKAIVKVGFSTWDVPLSMLSKAP